MEELELRRVEPERTNITTRSEFYRGVRHLYLEDIAAIYKVFWDITKPAREERLLNLAKEEERLARLAEEEERRRRGEENVAHLAEEEEKSKTSRLDDESFEELKTGIASFALLVREDERYANFTREIEVVSNLPTVMQAIREIGLEHRQDFPHGQSGKSSNHSLLDYYRTPEISMKSDQFHFDNLKQIESHRRAYLRTFEIRSKFPWNVVSIGNRSGVYVSMDVFDLESEEAYEAIRRILESRQSRLLRVVFDPRFNSAIVALLIAPNLIALNLDESSDLRVALLVLGFAVLLVFGLTNYLSYLFGRARVIPRHQVDSRSLWKERGPEIVIATLGLIVAILGVVITIMSN